MQLIEEQGISNRQKNRREILPLLSSINRPDQPGTIAVIKKMPVKFEKKQPAEKRADFSSWNMPVQENGVIKCREHDFW